jgi:pimeloyl-ACP methyl ester carboxylesterase
LDTTDVDGLRIAYERVGNGPALVLLHGYVGDGPTTWRPQLDALSDEFTVIAWDAPGAGQSSDPPDDFGIAGYAECLAGFIDILGFASAYAGWRGSLPAEVAERRLQQAFTLADLSPDEFVDALLPTMFSATTSPALVSSFGTAMRAFHSVGFRAMARASAEDARDALHHISVPTLVVCGDADERAPLSVADALHAAIIGSTLVVLTGVGHVCNIEAPEAFNSAVRTFLLG